MQHSMETRHDPHTILQIRSCSGREHATHREPTGMGLYYCNCGYSSGWTLLSLLPAPSEFFAEHRNNDGVQQ